MYVSTQDTRVLSAFISAHTLLCYKYLHVTKKIVPEDINHKKIMPCLRHGYMKKAFTKYFIYHLIRISNVE